MILETRRLKNDEKLPIDLLLLADETIEVINRYVNDSEVYILERGDKAVGIYALQKISKDSIEIKNIAVDEKLQGQGIGKFLLRDAANRAEGMGFKTIIIGTADASIQLLHFYQKEGFEIFDVKKNFFIDNYPEPIYENGIQLKHMVMLKREFIKNETLTDDNTILCCRDLARRCNIPLFAKYLRRIS
jgi:N-acetylglutamate synthase-like GNAT family acetyltransferase